MEISKGSTGAFVNVNIRFPCRFLSLDVAVLLPMEAMRIRLVRDISYL